MALIATHKTTFEGVVNGINQGFRTLTGVNIGDTSVIRIAFDAGAPDLNPAGDTGTYQPITSYTIDLGGGAFVINSDHALLPSLSVINVFDGSSGSGGDGLQFRVDNDEPNLQSDIPAGYSFDYLLWASTDPSASALSSDGLADLPISLADSDFGAVFTGIFFTAPSGSSEIISVNNSAITLMELPPVSTVSEPGALALMALPILALAALRRRRSA